jgi:hypothetical protein
MTLKAYRILKFNESEAFGVAIIFKGDANILH